LEFDLIKVSRQFPFLVMFEKSRDLITGNPRR